MSFIKDELGLYDILKSFLDILFDFFIIHTGILTQRAAFVNIKVMLKMFEDSKFV